MTHYVQEMTGQEAEYISLSRDTTETDLKQRREIQTGTAYHIDQVCVSQSNISVARNIPSSIHKKYVLNLTNEVRTQSDENRSAKLRKKKIMSYSCNWTTLLFEKVK